MHLLLLCIIVYLQYIEFNKMMHIWQETANLLMMLQQVKIFVYPFSGWSTIDRG